MKTPLTIALWTVSILALVVAGLIVAEILFIPVSLDPEETIAAGAQPWTDALSAAGAFVGLFVMAVLGLAFWHSSRFRAVGLALIVIEIGCVAWACVRVYADYF